MAAVQSEAASATAAAPAAGDVAISFEQETYLKKILVEDVLARELYGLVHKGGGGRSGTAEEALAGTTLLRFLHGQLIATFPPFTQRLCAQERQAVAAALDRFLLHLPRVNALSRKASRRDQQLTNLIAAATLDLFIRTRTERDADDRRYAALQAGLHAVRTLVGSSAAHHVSERTRGHIKVATTRTPCVNKSAIGVLLRMI
eukprot:TRINITY_DN5111_c0_g1_i1.p3 TRINITY_DN5111_c0_g1~~TRINITY_DN5111_c0_g1_i1.p3  ORF type:complete len:202 (-),score=62.87 TRINITY_DN5111_c0_g1_i1:844-1449(-)